MSTNQHLAQAGNSFLTYPTKIIMSDLPAQTPTQEQPIEDDSASDEEDVEGETSAAGELQPGGTLTSKQRKKKKSKAAQKLKKKLGMQQQPAAPQVTDDMLSQVHSAVSKSHGEQAASKVNATNLQEVLRLMNLERDATLEGQKKRVDATVNQIKDHKFWKTQPVMKGDAKVAEEGPIQPNAPPEKVKQEPYPLPKEFEWVTIDIDDAEEVSRRGMAT